MALPLNIDDLIHQRKVESARIEYKKDWNPEKVLHSVCAFANDIDNWGGGYIILGVEEKNGMPVLPPNGIRKESVDAVNKELLNVWIGKIVRAMRENGSPPPRVLQSRNALVHDGYPSDSQGFQVRCPKKYPRSSCRNYGENCGENCGEDCGETGE